MSIAIPAWARRAAAPFPTGVLGGVADVGGRLAAGVYDRILGRDFTAAPLQPHERAVPVDHLVVAGELVPVGGGVDVRTWVDDPDEVHRFEGPHRSASAVTEVLLHESVTRTHADAVRVLKRRGLGVQIAADLDGIAYQHADAATTRLTHAGGHNGPSIGIEVVSPYYPKHLRPGGGGRLIIDAPWAHLGRYVVPTRAQAETVAQLVAALTSEVCPLAIPRTWVGLGNRGLRMGLLADGQVRRPGIWAHHYSAHADGAWPVLYCYLRLQAGLDAADAYDEAVRLATGARGYVQVPRLTAAGNR